MRKLILGLILSILTPRLVSGQTAKDSWDNLKQLRSGQKTQVVDMNLKSFRGKLIGVTDEAISLRVKKEEVTVERDNVLRVTDRGRSKRVRNMVIGAAVGAGAGLAAGEAWARNAQPIAKYRGEYSAISRILIPIGAGAGAGVGAAFPSHPTIYRAKSRRRGAPDQKP
ncbi:MAG TPA: hypothetical protein VM182_06910 [Terriglobia bacterium]|nr:hypothetical protein [Terriglobia bacterium]